MVWLHLNQMVLPLPESGSRAVFGPRNLSTQTMEAAEV